MKRFLSLSLLASLIVASSAAASPVGTIYDPFVDLLHPGAEDPEDIIEGHADDAGIPFDESPDALLQDITDPALASPTETEVIVDEEVTPGVGFEIVDWSFTAAGGFAPGASLFDTSFSPGMDVEFGAFELYWIGGGGALVTIDEVTMAFYDSDAGPEFEFFFLLTEVDFSSTISGAGTIADKLEIEILISDITCLIALIDPPWTVDRSAGVPACNARPAAPAVANGRLRVARRIRFLQTKTGLTDLCRYLGTPFNVGYFLLRRPFVYPFYP